MGERAGARCESGARSPAHSLTQPAAKRQNPKMSSTAERTTAFKGLLEKGGFNSDAANDIATAAADEQVDLVDLDGLRQMQAC